MSTVLHIPARPGAPIACDMSTAQDTPDERLDDYRRLFERALAGRERRDDGVVLTFRAEGRAAVEDLVHREAACCPFMDYRVEVTGDTVVWTTTNPRSGDDRADVEVILDALYALSCDQRERSNPSATARMCASTSVRSSRTPGESRAPERVTIANVS